MVAAEADAASAATAADSGGGSAAARTAAAATATADGVSAWTEACGRTIATHEETINNLIGEVTHYTAQQAELERLLSKHDDEK